MHPEWRQLDGTAPTSTLVLRSWAWQYWEMREDYFYKLKLYNFSFAGKCFFSCLSPWCCWERRAVGQLIHSLCRGEETSLVCWGNVFVWAEKGTAKGNSLLPCGPALHRRRWSTTSWLHSHLSGEVERPDFKELPVFPLRFGFCLPLSSPPPSQNNSPGATCGALLQTRSWSPLLPAFCLCVPSFPPTCSYLPFPTKPITASSCLSSSNPSPSSLSHPSPLPNKSHSLKFKGNSFPLPPCVYLICL